MRGEESGRVGITDCEAGVRTGFAMTRFLQEVRCKAGGRTEASAPTHLPEVRGNCERCRQNVFDVTKENSL